MSLKPNESTDTTATGEPEITPAIQAVIDREVAAFATAHGIEAPVAEQATSALEALAQDTEHTTFVEKLEHLAANGYQATLHEMQDAPPALKALVTVVGELVTKVA
jgi:hypothetical protein